MKEFALTHNTDAQMCKDTGVVLTGEAMCKKYEARRGWAVSRCGALRSGIFKDCYKALSDDEASEAYQSCLYDACSCNRGDDCQCLCGNLAAFARKCSNLKGFHVKWRTQELCREFLSKFSDSLV